MWRRQTSILCAHIRKVCGSLLSFHLPLSLSFPLPLSFSSVVEDGGLSVGDGMVRDGRRCFGGVGGGGSWRRIVGWEVQAAARAVTAAAGVAAAVVLDAVVFHAMPVSSSHVFPQLLELCGAEASYETQTSKENKDMRQKLLLHPTKSRSRSKTSWLQASLLSSCVASLQLELSLINSTFFSLLFSTSARFSIQSSNRSLLIFLPIRYDETLTTVRGQSYTIASVLTTNTFLSFPFWLPPFSW